jgi:hypothetical protein
MPLKSKTYPEGRLVNGAGISGKVCAHYPGRSQGLFRQAGLLSSRGDGKSFEKSAEGIVGLGKKRAEGLNLLSCVESQFSVL